MKEFTHEELTILLVNKINELKKEKDLSEKLNYKLEEYVEKLEDVTARLEISDEKLHKKNETLKEEIREKAEDLLKIERFAAIGELSARISHDMKNPLSVLKNTLEILEIELGEKVDVNIKAKFERIDRSLYRISHQVDDVLDFVKRPKISKRENSLLNIVKEALTRNNIPDFIEIKLPDDDYIISCDADKLEVVFVNLFSNAIQAMANKSGKISVLFDNSDHRNMIIDMVDTGPGIPKKLIPKIFDPLFTTRQIGTGLGLPSCKSIIEGHGGKITVFSKVGEGTRFEIKLPKKTEFEMINDFDANKEKLMEKILFSG